MSSAKDAKKEKGPPRPQQSPQTAQKKPGSLVGLVAVVGVAVVALLAVLVAPRVLGSNSSVPHTAAAADARLTILARNVAPGEIVTGNA